MKAVLREEFIIVSAYTKESEISNKQCNLYLRALKNQEKDKPLTGKAVTKIRAESSEMEMLQTIQGIQHKKELA